jgi:hypothetical protein
MMANKTISELLIEQFCEINRIHYERIEPDGKKIPDYDINIDNRKIVVEVKQMEPNSKESEKIEELNKSGSVTIRTELGKRVRSKITASQRKFRRRTLGKHPSILVLYDSVKYHKHTEPPDILAAMYGQPYFPVEYSTSSARIGNIKHGPKRKMTESTNNSISAIGVLKKKKDSNPTLTIYHNKYSDVPLDYKLFAKFAVKQYEVEDINHSLTWKELS